MNKGEARMNRTYLKHEFLITARSMKNIPFVVFIGVLLLCYCFLLLPNEQVKETFYPEDTKEYLTKLDAEQQFRLKKGNTGIVLFSGMPVYANNAYYYSLYSALLAAYEDKNYYRYLHLRASYLEYNVWEYTNDKEYFKDSPFPGKDREHAYHQTMIRFEDYLSNNRPITYGLLMEKTGLQALQKFLLNYGMYFFLFCAIFFSSDVLTRNRKNRSVLQGLPLTWYRQLNLKTLSTFLYTSLFALVTIVIGVGLISIQYGFGYLNLDVPIMIAQQTFTREEYDVISMGTFIGIMAVAMLVLVYLFTRLTIAIGLLVKNEWVVLMICSALLFLEQFYFTRTTRTLGGIDISSFPQTYVDFGKVVTGEKNFLLNVETITMTKGIVVLLITVLLLEVFVWVLSRIINKRRFYKIG